MSPFIKKVLIYPNLIHTFSKHISFGSNSGAPLLAFQLNYVISSDCYIHYKFKGSNSIFPLKTGIPVFLVHPQIFSVKLEVVAMWSDRCCWKISIWIVWIYIVVFEVGTAIQNAKLINDSRATRVTSFLRLVPTMVETN